MDVANIYLFYTMSCNPAFLMSKARLRPEDRILPRCTCAKVGPFYDDERTRNTFARSSNAPEHQVVERDGLVGEVKYKSKGHGIYRLLVVEEKVRISEHAYSNGGSLILHANASTDY